MSKRGVTFPESVEDAKKCVPGPNVVFSKRALPISEYLSNVDKVGSLGCGPKKYPKYKNGKYCCVNVKSTDQEKLDYINNLLENAMGVIGITAFNKQKDVIAWLIDYRKFLLEDPNLEDNISVPDLHDLFPKYDDKNPPTVEDWYIKSSIQAKELSKFKTKAEENEQNSVDAEIWYRKSQELDPKPYRKNILKNIAQQKAAEAAQKKAAQKKAAQEKAAQEKAAQEKAAQEKAAENIDEVLDTETIMIEPSPSISLHRSQKNATVTNTKPTGCFGALCKTLGIKRNGGRKTKRLRKKYKKTRNIKNK